MVTSIPNLYWCLIIGHYIIILTINEILFHLNFLCLKNIWRFIVGPEKSLIFSVDAIYLIYYHKYCKRVLSPFPVECSTFNRTYGSISNWNSRYLFDTRLKQSSQKLKSKCYINWCFSQRLFDTTIPQGIVPEPERFGDLCEKGLVPIITTPTHEVTNNQPPPITIPTPLINSPNIKVKFPDILCSWSTLDLCADECCHWPWYSLITNSISDPDRGLIWPWQASMYVLLVTLEVVVLNCTGTMANS